MRKRITSSLLFLSLLIIFSASVSAEAPNLLSDYTNLDWQGDALYLDKESGSVYFKRNSDNTVQTATAALEIERDSTGFLFYIDIGNGASKGDSGYCTLQFFDNNGKELWERSTEISEKSENYVRYSIGENEKFYPVPEGAETVIIKLSVTGEGSGDKVNVYYRNFSLFFSESIPLCDPTDKAVMDSSTSLSKVEIGLTPYTRWIWVGIVFLVAMSFYLIRIWRQKYSAPRFKNK